jgi:hypothetical protein
MPLILTIALFLASGFSAYAAETTPAAKIPAECETQTSNRTVDRGENTANTARRSGEPSQDSTSKDSNREEPAQRKTSTQIVKEAVEHPKPAEGGQMVAETGRARPVESWAGCPPK